MAGTICSRNPFRPSSRATPATSTSISTACIVILQHPWGPPAAACMSSRTGRQAIDSSLRLRCRECGPRFAGLDDSCTSTSRHDRGRLGASAGSVAFPAAVGGGGGAIVALVAAVAAGSGAAVVHVDAVAWGGLAGAQAGGAVADQVGGQGGEQAGAQCGHSLLPRGGSPAGRAVTGRQLGRDGLAE